MAVKVQFEIGHTSKLRAKKTAEGFTHDWELYVKGVGKAEISIFVEKVVFTLHASFAKPKRAMKDPPYVIQESGYAGFILPIDIYFRNREEPKRVQFTYDLDLQHTGPPHHRFEVKKFIFENPSDEFRQKLIKGGGVPVAGVVSRTLHPAIKPANIALTDIDPRTTMNLAESALVVAKQKVSSDGKKHKPRHKEETKSNSFANLFGPPIKTNVNEPKQLNENTTSRSDSVEKFSKDKEYVEKNREKSDKMNLQKSMFNKMKSTAGSNGKSEKNSEGEKSKHKLHDKERIKRDKLESASSTLNLPKQPHSPMKADAIMMSGRGEDGKKAEVESVKQSEQKKSKKDKKDKERKREGNEEKHLNIDRRSSAENQASTASPLQKASSGNDLNEKKSVSHKEKKASLPENSGQSSKAAGREEKSHKYKKKLKSKDIEREKSHDKTKKTVKKSSSSKDISSHKSNYIEDSINDGGRVQEKVQRKEKSSKLKISSKNVEETKKSDSSSLDTNNAEKNDKYENMSNYQNNTQSNHSSSLSTGLPVSEESSNGSFQETSTKYFSKKSKDATNKEQNRSSSKTVEGSEREDRKRSLMNNENSNASKLSFLEPPTKQAKREQNTKSPEGPAVLTQTNLHKSNLNLNSLAPEYMNELQELHKKIIALQDDHLQQVVELIASTGCYEITTKTFDFDLCRLNQNIVQRLQELLSNSTA